MASPKTAGVGPWVLALGMIAILVGVALVLRDRNYATLTAARGTAAEQQIEWEISALTRVRNKATAYAQLGMVECFSSGRVADLINYAVEHLDPVLGHEEVDLLLTRLGVSRNQIFGPERNMVSEFDTLRAFADAMDALVRERQ